MEVRAGCRRSANGAWKEAEELLQRADMVRVVTQDRPGLGYSTRVRRD